jgi:hypothetical protein
MSSVASMKSVQSQKMVDPSSEKQKFAAERVTSTFTSNENNIRPAVETPYFPNGTIRCGSCTNKTRGIGVGHYLLLEQANRPRSTVGTSGVKTHVKYGNY